MRSKRKIEKKQVVTPIHVELPAPTPAAEAAVAGEVGRAAARAATLHQLQSYADEVEQFVNSAQLESLLNRVQADLERAPGTPQMRLRRE